MLAKQMIASKQTHLGVEVTDLNDLEIVRNIKRELVRMHKEIGTITNVEEKKEALKAYAELLTNLEIGTLPKERRSG